MKRKKCKQCGEKVTKYQSQAYDGLCGDSFCKYFYHLKQKDMALFDVQKQMKKGV